MRALSNKESQYYFARAVSVLDFVTQAATGMPALKCTTQSRSTGLYVTFMCCQPCKDSPLAWHTL
jgi:hypothetical protein